MTLIIKTIIHLSVLVTIFIMMTGCGANHMIIRKSSNSDSYKDLNQEISGRWQVIDSNARFIITFIDGTMHIEGWDSSDGEKFNISDLEWNGKRLKCTFLMPSTGKTRHSDLLFIDKNILKGFYEGDASGEEIWRRE